jgi:hypothetical protein
MRNPNAPTLTTSAIATPTTKLVALVRITTPKHDEDHGVHRDPLLASVVLVAREPDLRADEQQQPDHQQCDSDSADHARNHHCSILCAVSLRGRGRGRLAHLRDTGRAMPEDSMTVQWRYAQVSEWVDGVAVQSTDDLDVDEGRAAADRLAEERG